MPSRLLSFTKRGSYFDVMQGSPSLELECASTAGTADILSFVGDSHRLGRPLHQQVSHQVFRLLLGQPVEQFAPYAGEAAAVMADAIAKAGADRAGVVKAVFATKGGGILGPYTITPSGDPSVGPITVSVARKTFVPVQELNPAQSLVGAARQG